MRKIARDLACEFPGAEIGTTRKGHYKVRLANGETLYTGSSPSDWRALANMRSQARKLMAATGVQPGATMPFARFEKCSGRPDGRLKDGIKATCPQCQRAETVYLDRPQIQDVDEPLIVGKFEKRGWIIGATSSRHLCPKCSKPALAAPRKEARTVARKEARTVPSKAVPTTAISGVSTDAAASKEPSKEDKRIIHAKITEVYVGEVNYSGDWSDRRVAADLGVNQAWVAAIREEFFGPDVNEQSSKLSEARALLAEIEIGVAKLEPIIAQFGELTAKVEQMRVALHKVQS